MERPYFIVNGTAGSGRSAKCFEEVRAELDRRGIPYGYEYTQAKRHAVELTQAALEAGERVIVAVGGDGTVNEVASVVYGSGAVMGVLPFGTGNDVARALKLPVDAMAALDVVLNGTVRQVDAGLANERFFINVAGIGFDVDVLVNTERYKRRFNGMLPYMLGIIKTLSQLRALPLTIVADGRRIEQPATLIAVGNGTHFGGGMPVTPNADPFDGEFDVCLIKGVSKLMFMRLLPVFLKGRHISWTKYVDYFRAKEVRVECASDPHGSERSPIELDGEVQGGMPVTFSMQAGAMRMLLPKAQG